MRLDENSQQVAIHSFLGIFPVLLVRQVKFDLGAEKFVWRRWRIAPLSVQIDTNSLIRNQKAPR